MILGDPWDAWPGKDTVVSRCWPACWLCFSELILTHTLGLLRCSAVCLAALLTGSGTLTFTLNSLVYMVTHCFPSLTSSLPLPSCDIINKKEDMLFSWRELHVFIGHRLQWALLVHLFLAVILFYVQQCTLQTKVKLGEVYVSSSRQTTGLCVA